MIKLMHKYRRGPGEIELVGGVKYELDVAGCISVPQEAADKLLMGAMWRDPSVWEKQAVKLEALKMPEAVGGSRRPRTKEELAAQMEQLGLKPSGPTPAMVALQKEADAKAAARASNAAPKLVSEPPPAAVPEPPPAASEPEEPPPGEEDEAEKDEIIVSDSMTKAELLVIAKEAGYQVRPAMTKKKILEMFEEEE